MHVLHLRRPLARTRGVVSVVVQEVIVVLQVRAAAASVRDDRIEFIERARAAFHRVNVPPRHVARRVQFAIVPVQRAAAVLHARRHDFAAIREQHVHGVTVHARIREVLHAAGEHPHAFAGRGFRSLHLGNEHIGKITLHARCERFEFAESLRQQPQQAEFLHEPLHPARLVDAQRAADGAKQPRACEDPAQHHAADPVPLFRVQDSRAFDVRARLLKHPRVVHARRARRLAREAAEAEIHLVAKRLGEIEPPLGDIPHELDASARAVLFELRRVVSRARRQAQAAMDALREHAEIEILQIKRLRAGRGRQRGFVGGRVHMRGGRWGKCSTLQA